MTVFHERYQGSHEVSVFIPLPGVDHGGHGVRENEPLYGIWEGLRPQWDHRQGPWPGVRMGTVTHAAQCIQVISVVTLVKNQPFFQQFSVQLSSRMTTCLDLI